MERGRQIGECDLTEPGKTSADAIFVKRANALRSAGPGFSKNFMSSGGNGSVIFGVE